MKKKANIKIRAKTRLFDDECLPTSPRIHKESMRIGKAVRKLLRELNADRTSKRLICHCICSDIGYYVALSEAYDD